MEEYMLLRTWRFFTITLVSLSMAMAFGLSSAIATQDEL